MQTSHFKHNLPERQLVAGESRTLLFGFTTPPHTQIAPDTDRPVAPATAKKEQLKAAVENKKKADEARVAGIVTSFSEKHDTLLLSILGKHMYLDSSKKPRLRAENAMKEFNEKCAEKIPNAVKLSQRFKYLKNILKNKKLLDIIDALGTKQEEAKKEADDKPDEDDAEEEVVNVDAVEEVVNVDDAEESDEDTEKPRKKLKKEPAPKKKAQKKTLLQNKIMRPRGPKRDRSAQNANERWGFSEGFFRVYFSPLSGFFIYFPTLPPAKYVVVEICFENMCASNTLATASTCIMFVLNFIYNKRGGKKLFFFLFSVLCARSRSGSRGAGAAVAEHQEGE